MRAGDRKPLGKSMQNGRKWFATVDMEQASANADWLDKAIRIIGKSINEKNNKQRGESGRWAGKQSPCFMADELKRTCQCRRYGVFTP